MSTSSMPRMGITKSKAGHYAVWCSGVSVTVNLLSSIFRARDVIAALKIKMAAGADIDAKRAIFAAEARYL